MSKYLKRYNKETNEWELISAPDVSVIQVLESGSDITDTNVVVTCPDYSDRISGETNTLNETLTVISDDISKLQRNVSWLAEHGGGGGTGSGGTAASFGIEVISPVLTNGAAYVSGKTFEIEFMITGGSEGDVCSYSYIYDNDIRIDYTPLEVGKSVKIPIDNTGKNKKEYSMIIRAINPYGTQIAPKTFTIYESTLSLAFDVETAGADYINGVYNIKKDSTYAWLPLIITNGLMNSETVVTAKINEYTTSKTFTNTTTQPQKLQISLWDLFEDASTVKVGEYYVITFNASATLGTNTINSNEVQLRVLIVNPNAITITLGVNGVSGLEVQAPLGSSVVYNFKVYVPATVPPITSTYYAAKIVNGANSYLVLGQYYDDDTHNEGKDSYDDNPLAAVETLISSQFVLDASRFNSGDTIQLCIRAWSADGLREATAMTSISVIKASDEVFPRQSNTRGGQGDTGGTVFLSWNKENADVTSPAKWNSTFPNYAYLDSVLKETYGTNVTADINLYDSSSASGIKPGEGLPYLRIQNRAYAIADISAYANELQQMVSSNDGFTISFSFKADIANDSQHTHLLWGRNGSDNTLLDGIRIDADKVYWEVHEKSALGNINPYTLVCPVPSNKHCTVDFAYVRTSIGNTVRIYVDGILNAAQDVYSLATEYVLPSTIYFGANYRNSSLENFSDLNVYEFSVYTKSLNDLQLIVNDKNSKFAGLEDYIAWKNKNFISASPSDVTVPVSVFFDGDNYLTEFDDTKIHDIAVRSKIPTVSLWFSDDAGFDQEYFYEKHTTEDTGKTFNGSATYYDPDTNRTEEFSNLVTLQGTSTLGYRVKNLELYVNESFEKDGNTYTKLFQPKEDWFPESQFTLKADIVDSAHANNAVLGEWINNSGMFQDNPAMQQFEANRPDDMDDSGAIYGKDEQVTIKHTLEGFPVLLFIKFSKTNYYTFLGIYSFNLGRYSYYNMGMKFLKGFSRREGLLKVSCPKIINYYEEMDNLGSVSASNVYSFEMGNNGNLKVAEYPVWSQWNRTVIDSYGDFKYPSSVGTDVWTNLCNLFKSIADFNVTNYYGDSYTAYQNISGYTIVNGNYVLDGTIPAYQNNNIAEITSRLNLNNAIAYFVIANAFGMTDSLGKNLTIRTWDAGQQWWFCFYDMDTALALANDGTESNPPTVAIDKVEMISDPATMASVLSTTYHDDKSKYAAVLSKIWGVFRDTQFRYNLSDEKLWYEYMWASLRQTGGKLATSDNFTNLMAERVDKNGEIIYNYDYNTKYIQDTAKQEGAAAAITFLHGTRVEYVRDWLRKHFYFLDGMFDISRLNQPSFSFPDSPYNSTIATIVASYSSTIPVITYTVQTSTPTFMGLSLGGDSFKKYYIASANTDTVLYFVNGTSSNSQLMIKASSLLTRFDGLQGGFQAIGSNTQGVLVSLGEFNAQNSSTLNENPILTSAFVLNGDSSLEKVDLSNTKGAQTLNTYAVNLENCNRLISVNVYNSDVTSLSLPQTALQYLNVAKSRIKNFTINGQNALTGISFDECTALQTLSVSSCAGLTGLRLSGLPLLQSVSVLDCGAMSSITIDSCPALQTVGILNNGHLKEIRITNCANSNLSITVNGCSPETLIFNGTNSSNPISLPSRESLTGVTLLSINDSYNFGGFKFGAESVEQYGGYYVLDLTPFTSLDGANFTARNVLTIHYLRVPNDSEAPFNLLRQAFEGSINVLTRVFGHFTISQNGLFGGCSNFYLRESTTTAEGTPFEEPEWQSDIYGTNVTIATDDLGSCFESTHCSLGDVYYIFHISEDVVNMNAAFASCENVITTHDDNLSPDLFTLTPNLENITNLFNGANIGGYIYETILEPIKGNVVNFINVFGTNDGRAEEDRYCSHYQACFFPSGNIIKNVTGFNPKPYNLDDPGSEDPMFDNELLRTLTSVEVISNSFNDCKVAFYGPIYDECDLFVTTTKLKTISNSFLRIHGEGSLKNIFGGNHSTPSTYPQALESVTHSFSFIDGSDHSMIPCPLIDDEGQRGVLMPIGNSFFKKIKSTIKNVGGGSLAGAYFRCFFSEEHEGIKKYIDLDDCDGENFCYEIFDGCANLEEIPHFFDGIDFGVTGKTYSELSLLFDSHGRSLFQGLTKLRNIASIFNGMKNVSYRLEGEAFKDCALVNVSSAFAENNAENCAKKIGAIPFKLFYQETTGSVSSNVYGISEKTADELGIYDGYVGPVANDKFLFSNVYKVCKSTIEDASYVFENSNSNSIEAYSASATTFDDWVEDNVNYNPAKYYLAINGDTATYTLNPNYDPYKKVWNKFVYDGTITDFNTMVTSSAEYQKIVRVFAGEDIPEVMDDYGNPIVDEVLPAQFQPNYSEEGSSVLDLSKKDTGFERSEYLNLYSTNGGLFSIRNYFCAPDIFRYCKNAQNTNIDNAFANGSPIITNNGCGIKGTIPPYLLEPINSVNKIMDLFASCQGILPYKWAKYLNGEFVASGQTYPIELFSGLTNLSVLSGIFARTYVWGRTMIPLMFSTNGVLTDVSGIWNGATWVDDSLQQIPFELFYNNPQIMTVASMFSGGGPKIMSQQLFVYSIHPRIKNCSGFLNRGVNVSDTSTVPVFWQNFNISDFRNAYVGISETIQRNQGIPPKYCTPMS